MAKRNTAKPAATADDGVGGEAQGPRVHWLQGSGEMGKVVLAKDWSQTPLGPIDAWPQSLRTTVSLALASNFPIAIVWGPQRIQLYNDGYWPICGAKHPRSMGQDFKECWLSAWPVIGDAFERATAGETAFLVNQRLFIDRNGYLEEAFFTFSFSPIRDESGAIVGLFHPVMELTQQSLAERRLKILRDLADETTEAKSVEDAAALVAKTLAHCELDLPFVLLYLVDPEGKRARLSQSIRLTPATGAAAVVVDLSASASSSGWPLADAARSRQVVQVDRLEGRFGLLNCGPYPEMPNTAIVMPISIPAMEHPLGLMVAGVSPRRELDAPHRQFLGMLAEAVTNALSKARAYEEERKRAEALAELDRAKTVFFSNVSHEFRTPLTLMLGPLEDTLANAHGALPPDAAATLQIAHRNSLRLLRLVNTLLDFSRVEAGRIEASYEPTDLAVVTADLASVFRSAVEKAGLRLVVDCLPLPEPVFVDREMWEKIVLNLLSNAFKATFAGEIGVSLRCRGERVELRVSDTGIGIPPEDVARIFQRFHRVKNAHSRSHEGTGIGLALVQELVQLHQGEVSVESREGHGSTFIVALPLGKGHLPGDRIDAPRHLESTSIGAAPFVEEALRWVPEETKKTASALNGHGLPPPVVALPVSSQESGVADATTLPPASSARVLVVDDNADMRDYISRLLAVSYKVEVAPDGQAALDIIRVRPPDLVLSDVMMPRLDGFGLLQALRANERTCTIPIILLSARAGEESRIEGRAAGADDYLIKPFSARELVARVRSQLELTGLRRRTEQTLRDSEERLRQSAGELELARRAALNLMEDALEAKEKAASSERRFRTLVTATSDIVYRMSADWTEMRQLQGRGVIADTEKPNRDWLQDYIHPNDQARVLAVISEAIRNKSIFEMEHQVRRVDGTLGWTFSRAIPLTDAKGEIVEWFGAASDVTERKRAESALRESAERFRFMAESMPQKIFTANPGGEVNYHNAQWVEFTGLAFEEIRDWGWTQFIHRDDVDGNVRRWKQSIETGEFFQLEHRFRRKDGVYHWHLSRAHALRDAAGKVVMWIGSSTDIDDQKKAQEELRAAQAQLSNRASQLELAVTDRTSELVKTNDQLESFVYSVAHDLRGPLRAMQGFSALLLEEAGSGLSEMSQDFASRINRSALFMDALLRDLLIFSRLSQRLIELAPVDLLAVVRTTLSQLEQEIQTKGAAVETPGPWPSALAHEATVGQVLYNLIGNALKFVTRERPPVIRLRTEERGALIRVWVEDNGVGIEPEHHGQIFRLFNRLHGEKFPGTGIGLTIVQKGAERMGGQAGVESTPGEGSRFWFELPKAQPVPASAAPRPA